MECAGLVTLERSAFLCALSGRRFASIALAEVTIAAIVRVAIARYANVFEHDFLFYFPVLNLPQFLAGALLGRLFVSHGAMHTTAHRILFSVGCAATLSIVMLKPIAPVASNDVFLCVAFALTIYGASAMEWRLLDNRMFTLLGEASYAVYILHVPLWLWWNHVTTVVLRAHLPAVLDFALYSSLVLTASIASFKFVEQPVNKWRKSRLSEKPMFV
jgi:peptidoglycan/LPS O-acetylase OafA/YrhL